LNRRAAVPGDAEGPLVERPKPAGPAPGPLGKDEEIAAGCKIFSDVLNIADHERRIIVSRLRRDVTGLPQNPAEERHVEKGVLDDRLLFLEQGNKENRVEIRQVVADDNGRADGPDLILDIQGDPGDDEAQQSEEPPEEKAIQALEGGFPIRPPKRGRRITGGK
jgi:hypothetical protein